MNQRNSTNVVWIDTHRVTLCEMDADIALPHADYRQGLDATNPVPRISMFAGEPSDIFSEADNQMRGVFWRIASVALIAFWCAVVIVVCQQ